MRISEIPLAGVRAGKTWRLAEPASRFGDDMSLANLGPIEELDKAQRDDFVVYSALAVRSDGKVTPLLVLKELATSECGDYLEYVGGRWRPIEPDPSIRYVEQYVANPHPRDPSFAASDHDERGRQRKGFARYASKIK